ncbi:hypothetical protein ACOMHN_032927 [Nucella lapillus]
MPAKGRHSGRKKRIREKQKREAGTMETEHTNHVSTEAGQATGCSVCHRSDQPVFRCPSHRICELCMKRSGAVNNLRCPLCPHDSLSSKVGFVINKVKNLWMCASNDRQAQSGTQSCSVHTTQTLEFLCQKCDMPVCPYCKLAEHEGHETRSLSLVIAEAKQRIADATGTHLSDFKNRLHVALKENRKRGKNFRQTQKEVEQSITRRHAQLKNIIDKHRDSALRKLGTMCEEVESCLKEDEARLNSELNTLADLQHRIDHSLADTDAGNVLSVDREVQANWSNDSIMRRRSVALPSYAYKVEHDFRNASTSSAESAMNIGLVAGSADIDKLKKFVEGFIGHPVLEKTTLPKMPVDVSVKPMFHCCQDPEAVVFSVCHAGDEKVAVSYSTSSDSKGVTRSFFEDGRPSKSFDFGLCTLSGEGNGSFRTVTYHLTKYFGMSIRIILSKSGRKQALIHIENDPGWVLVSYFMLPFPLCKIFNRVFPSRLLALSCDTVAPLKCDVTQNGDVVAIVDVKDHETPPLGSMLESTSRVVKVISISEDFCYTDVYEPPSPDFVPSDVCFFSLEGRTVLLVSDTGTSSIHVLGMQPIILGTRLFTKCHFLR